MIGSRCGRTSSGKGDAGSSASCIRWPPASSQRRSSCDAGPVVRGSAPQSASDSTFDTVSYILPDAPARIVIATCAGFDPGQSSCPSGVPEDRRGRRGRSDPARKDRSVTAMDEEVGAAVRRFPARQAAIEALAARDEEFRSLCADFADAEAALRHWQVAESPMRERLSPEYRQLVEELADEVEMALNAVP